MGGFIDETWFEDPATTRDIIVLQPDWTKKIVQYTSLAGKPVVKWNEWGE